MGSKSTTTDATSTTTQTTILDRKAVQQQGMQILDSVIVDPSDTVMVRAMENLRAGFLDASERNTTTVGNFMALAVQLLSLADKGQVRMNEFGYQALVNARNALEAMENTGALVVKLADAAIGDSFDLAEKVAAFQQQAQRDALEIVAETKTGDYSDSLKIISGMVMLFSLASLYIVGKK